MVGTYNSNHNSDGPNSKLTVLIMSLAFLVIYSSIGISIIRGMVMVTAMVVIVVCIEVFLLL